MKEDEWSGGWKFEIRKVEEHSIQSMDELCKKHNIHWQPDGIEFRSVLLAAMFKAYWAGRYIQYKEDLKQVCVHDFVYDVTGGICTKCGQTSLKCSSD